MQQSFLSVALTNFSLFNEKSGSREVLTTINQITGISIPELVHAERRIQRTGSLIPLRELLVNPNIQRAEKFSFKIDVKKIHKGKSSPKEKVASRFSLEISSARGKVEIEIMMVMRRRFLTMELPLHTAQIQITYNFHQGNQIRTHTQNLRIADRGRGAESYDRPSTTQNAAFAA